MLSQEQIDTIYEDLIHPFHFLWFKVGYAHGISIDQVDPDSFEERMNDFFFLVGKLLDEGKLKLGNRKDERIMKGSTEELVERFRQCFPDSDEALKEGLWLVMEECPFVAAWLFKTEVEGEPDEDDYDWCF
ncbi:DUF596 domain-containing protein [Xylella taiwanensis]|uniref:DUF596 domain-containing protein n=1 Tax=Xylella taiwanensis TaxID=1444770 RepID=Z9JF43_9GAMM|nr:DUF596 domain-containing protein [Xylella taiwanensis]AXI83691.1 hypothetical protein AB672_06970 [Xylella taiwanensis]EWS77000.1 hypothetical protein AF72_13065 [Xylella taiwanensis]MCD8456782.1 DUF596 domain-containing protein [Xylella taiwanensis]MCD8459192.1 DUF596 domain-containing protein [Xylella taiwanensis]MCD8461916.1 DUF596 domain-containing protein [Xylella taiwanensis]